MVYHQDYDKNFQLVVNRHPGTAVNLYMGAYVVSVKAIVDRVYLAIDKISTHIYSNFT